MSLSFQMPGSSSHHYPGGAFAVSSGQSLAPWDSFPRPVGANLKLANRLVGSSGFSRLPQDFSFSRLVGLVHSHSPSGLVWVTSIPIAFASCVSVFAH